MAMAETIRVSGFHEPIDFLTYFIYKILIAFLGARGYKLLLMSKISIFNGKLSVYNRKISDEAFRALDNQIRQIMDTHIDSRDKALTEIKQILLLNEGKLENTLYETFDLSDFSEIWVHPGDIWRDEHKIEDLIGFRPEQVHNGFFMLFIDRIFTDSFIAEKKLHLLTDNDENRIRLNNLTHDLAYGEELFDAE